MQPARWKETSKMPMKPPCLLAGLVALAGCANLQPTPTTAQAPTRQLLGVADLPDRATAIATFKHLPARLDAATAEKVLVKLDPKQVEQTDGKRTLQRWLGLGWGFPWHSYLYGAYSYYPYGSYYYPYSYAGGYYYPYSYAGYYPFFYRRFGLYSPFYWW
jgi:hypothetical protein